MMTVVPVQGSSQLSDMQVASSQSSNRIVTKTGSDMDTMRDVVMPSVSASQQQQHQQQYFDHVEDRPVNLHVKLVPGSIMARRISDLMSLTPKTKAGTIDIMGATSVYPGDTRGLSCVYQASEEGLVLVDALLSRKMGSSIFGWKLPSILAGRILLKDADEKFITKVVSLFSASSGKLARVNGGGTKKLARYLFRQTAHEPPALPDETFFGLYKILGEDKRHFEVYLVMGSCAGCLSSRPLLESRLMTSASTDVQHDPESGATNTNNRERHLNDDLVAEMTHCKRGLEINMEQMALKCIIELADLSGLRYDERTRMMSELSSQLVVYSPDIVALYENHPPHLHHTTSAEEEETFATEPADGDAAAMIPEGVMVGLHPTVYTDLDILTKTTLGMNVININTSTTIFLAVRDNPLSGLHLVSKISEAHALTTSTTVHKVSGYMPTIFTDLNQSHQSEPGHSMHEGQSQGHTKHHHHHHHHSHSHHQPFVFEPWRTNITRRDFIPQVTTPLWPNSNHGHLNFTHPRTLIPLVFVAPQTISLS